MKRSTQKKVEVRIDVPPADEKFVRNGRGGAGNVKFKTWRLTKDGYVYVGELPRDENFIGGAAPVSVPQIVRAVDPDPSKYSKDELRLTEKRLVFVTDVIVDFDIAEIPKSTLEKLPRFLYDVYHTGRGWHFHIPIWCFMEEEKAKKLFDVIKAVFSQFEGVDASTISPYHNVRLPNTPSPRTGVRKTLVARNYTGTKSNSYVQILKTYESFLTKVKQKTSENKKTNSVDKPYITPFMLKVMWRGVKMGMRNRCAYILSTILRFAVEEGKISIVDAARFLKTWNRRNNPPLDDHELEAAARLIFDEIYKDAKPLTDKAYAKILFEVVRTLEGTSREDDRSQIEGTRDNFVHESSDVNRSEDARGRTDELERTDVVRSDKDSTPKPRRRYGSFIRYRRENFPSIRGFCGTPSLYRNARFKYNIRNLPNSNGNSS